MEAPDESLQEPVPGPVQEPLQDSKVAHRTEPEAAPQDQFMDADAYHSMTAEWEAYFASQKYQSRDSAWRDAVLAVLAELNILEEAHRSDPYKAVRAVADEGARRAFRRRSTD